MGKKYTPLAIAYDFDGTLAPGNMPEHSFIPELGLTSKEFWDEVKELARDKDMDEILAYMHLLLKKARSKDLPITRQAVVNHGKGLTFFDGVENYFDRITEYGRERMIRVEHYIISSGLKELIEGTTIGRKFKHIFASKFLYDVNGVAAGPAAAVNYTTKTQFLFRINKGIYNCWDNQAINKFTPEEERPVPFRNIVYLGDGETDVPAMKMVTYQGGDAIAVYDRKKRANKEKRSAKEIARELIQHKRANYAVPADYTENSPLDQLMKAIIDRTAANVSAGKSGTLK